MTCRELAELLIDYVQGDMDVDLHENIRRHLCACPPCETFLETYRITIQLTRKLPVAPLPPELKVRLEAALREIQSERGP